MHFSLYLLHKEIFRNRTARREARRALYKPPCSSFEDESESSIYVQEYCNGVTQMVVITRYIGVVHTERDEGH